LWCQVYKKPAFDKSTIKLIFSFKKNSAFSFVRLLCDFNEDLEAVKEFYNENYEEICENLFPEDLLKLPERISGFYLDHDSNKVTKGDRVENYERFAQMLKNDYICNKRLPSIFLRLFLCTTSFYRPQNQAPTLH
jgi:hypothetical protein